MAKTKKHSVAANALFCLRWHLKIAPVYTVFEFLRAAFNDIISLLEHTFLLAYIIDCVEKGRTLTDILYFFIPVAAATVFKLTVNPFMRAYVVPKYDAKVKKAIRLTLYQKAVNMEIEKYDNSEFYNDFVWAMQKAPDYINMTVEKLRQCFAQVVVALLAGSYVIATDSVTLVVAVLVIGIAILVQNGINKAKMKREEDTVPVSRKRDYINRVFYLIDYVKDIKTSEISDKLEKDFAETSDKMKDLVDKHGYKIAAMATLRDSADYVVYEGLFLTYLFYQTLVNGKYGLGGLMAVYRAADSFCYRLRKAVMMFPMFLEYSLYVQKLRTFLDTENTMQDNGASEVPHSGDITLKDVHFTYPGNEAPTINGVSMHIRQGEKIALVGYNGAGKSTLIKLLLRLYDPSRGAIEFGGKGITDYPLADYRERYGALFQDFEIIATSLGHNINMSNAPLNTELADEVLRKAAFWERFQALPAGYDTQLTKEFEDQSIGLSGGEAQKIALARVLYADSAVIILDEPSSALDPIAEYQLNKTVTELAEDKTVIIISHRLSTTRFVDKIYMLENGQIIEQGDHDTLLARKGKYAEMFAVQAEKYRQK